MEAGIIAIDNLPHASQYRQLRSRTTPSVFRLGAVASNTLLMFREALPFRTGAARDCRRTPFLTQTLKSGVGDFGKRNPVVPALALLCYQYLTRPIGPKTYMDANTLPCPLARHDEVKLVRPRNRGAVRLICPHSALQSISKQIVSFVQDVSQDGDLQ